ncbi:MAG: DsbA family protein [Alphaproteobacteria bacterium]
MTDRHLIYFADPMCSWCYGFWPVISAVRAAFGDTLPVRLVMGGLRPGTTEPMTEEDKAKLRGHWAEVAAASGQAFSDTAMAGEGFIYDTDPAARAVVVIRRERPVLALDYLGALQRAFYGEGRDITQEDVLAEVLGEVVPGADLEAFRINWRSEDAENETWADYAISQKSGVTGFPTLVGGPDDTGKYGIVTRGFAPAEQVLPVLVDWIGRPVH